MYLDEMSNEDLERLGASEHLLDAEASRVRTVIERHALIGSDLSHFLERERIIRQLLQSGRRDTRLR